MPNTESAKKRVRQSAERNAINNWRKRQVKEQIKALLTAIHDRKIDAAETEFRKTVSLLDKVGSTSTMHRNTADRRKRRLHKRLHALKAGTKSG